MTSYEDDVIDRMKQMENAPAYRKDALEQEIITIIGNERYQTNRNFHEHANALRIVEDGIELHNLLVSYVPKVDAARKGMYFARNVEGLDVIIPGNIPEIGSAWATSKAAEKISEASQMLSEISQKISGSKYVADLDKYGLPSTNLIKEMEGLDLLVNMVRGGLRIDITSIINVAEQDKTAKLIRDMLRSLLEFIQKLKRLGPAQKRLDDKIVGWSYEEWDRIKIKYYESL